MTLFHPNRDSSVDKVIIDVAMLEKNTNVGRKQEVRGQRSGQVMPVGGGEREEGGGGYVPGKAGVV